MTATDSLARRLPGMGLQPFQRYEIQRPLVRAGQHHKVTSTPAATNVFADIFGVHREDAAADRTSSRVTPVNAALYSHMDLGLWRHRLRSQIGFGRIKWYAERLPAPAASNRFSENAWCRMEHTIAMRASEYFHDILDVAAI